jgi:DNA polymerase IV
VSDRPSRSILHVDMDAFFVSVELLERPELRGRPVIVGGDGRRGVVAAASYEARAYGVHSAMSSSRARRLCPHAVFLPGRHRRYGEVSRQVMEVFRSFTPLVEPISLDEAFLDVTGSKRLLGPATILATEIRERVETTTGLTCSVGVAPNKFIAKLASEAAKPRASTSGPLPGLGVKVVTPDEVLDFLHPLAIEALWGVGPATADRLHGLGISTVGDLASSSLGSITATLGKAAGRHLHALASGVDDREVEPERRPKSVGHEETFAHDLRARADLDREVVRMADAVSGRLRRHGLAGRTVTLKVRFHDFRTITRSVTLHDPVDTTPAITAASRELLDGVDPSAGVRLLGVSVSGLVDEVVRQLSFDDLAGDGPKLGGPTGTGGAPATWDTASDAVDQIRARFGSGAIGPASTRPGVDRPTSG